MILTPSIIDELGDQLRDANEIIEKVDLSALNRLIDHKPEDMTATVEAGMKLSEFQDAIRHGRQWLPLDPPDSENLSISELISSNASGPSRYGFGTVRDWLIGIRFFLSDGRSVFNGGRVVKNVAGFDLCKLMVGSRGTLGVITEATFKLMPIAEQKVTTSCSCRSLKEASSRIKAIWDSLIQPSVLDLIRENGEIQLILGISGSKPDVTAQMKSAENIGDFKAAELTHESRLRKRMPKVISVTPEQ